MPMMTQRAQHRHPIEYSGNDPQRLATEIEGALRRYARGDDHRLLAVIEFFEGELKLIAKTLRAYGVGKSGKSAP
jgi:hypothetical protein